MYDKAMSAAVETAQKRLMNTTDKDSVLMSVTYDLKELCTLTEKLDPSKINFDKGGLEKLKIMSYWNRFENNYPLIKELFEKLVRSKKILFNSITTIKRFYSEYDEVYGKFRAIPEGEQDADHTQQAIISENMYQLLKNSVHEHEVVYKHLESVISNLGTSLDMAIYLARKTSDYNFGGSIAGSYSNITSLDYKLQFSRLSELLNS